MMDLEDLGFEEEESVDSRLLARFDPRILNGVTATWLGQAFNMDVRTVRRRLAALPPKGRGKGNAELYDFVEACGYLIKPKIDVEEYVKTIRADQLPPKLNKDYWDALLKKQKYEEQAGDLWRTEKIREVFGSTFKIMKASMNLWYDTIKTRANVTSEQKEVLKDLIDALQTEIYEALIKQSLESKTESSLHDGTPES